MTESGEAVEGLIPKIQEAFDKYTKGSVSIIDKQNGGLNDTYTILKQLSKVYPTLNNEARAYLNEAIAGNRQNKVLVAIMENWKNVESAVVSAKNSTGSALKENEKYLNSINGKMAQFKSSTQQLWQNLISSDVIKFFVDLGTIVVKTLDAGFVRFIATVALVTTSIGLLIKGFTLLKNSMLATTIQYYALMVATEGLKAATIDLWGILSASPLFWVAAGTAAIYGLVKVFDALTVSVEEQREKVDDLTQKYNDLKEKIKSLREAQNPTEQQREYIGLLERELELQEEILKVEQKRLMDKEIFGKGVWGKGLSKEIEDNLQLIGDFEKYLKSSQEELQRSLDMFGDDDSWIEHIEDLKSQTKELELELIQQKKVIDEWIATWGVDAPQDLKDLSKAIEDSLPKLQAMNGYVKDNSDSTNDSNQSMKQYIQTLDQLTKAQEKLNDTVDDAQSSFKTLAGYYQQLADGEKLTSDNMLDLIQNYPDMLKYMDSEGNLLISQKELIKNLFELKKQDLILTIENEKIKTDATLQSLEIQRKAYLGFYEHIGKVTLGLSETEAMAMFGFDQETYNKALQASKQFAAQIAELRNLTFKTYDKKNKTSESSLSPIPYEDLTKELIKSYNAEVERDKIAEKLLNKQIKQAERAKDYNKAIETQNKLLDNQQKTIADLQKANQKIHEEANRLRSTSKYDTTSWFDNNGGMTLAYKELLNSFAGKTDEFSKKEKESIEDLFSKLSLLKKGWYDNADAIDTYTENMYQSQQQVEAYKKSLEDLAEEELKRIQDQHKALQSQADEKLKLYSDTEKEVVNLLKKRYDEEQKLRQRNYNDTIQKLDDEKKAYQEFVNEKIDALDREYSKDDYDQNVGDQTKVIADIQKEIDKFTLAATTGDMEAISKVVDLRKQKAEEERKLTETQTKRSRDLQKQNLQDNLKDYEKYIDTKKRAEEEAFEQYKRNLQDMTEETAIKLEAQQMLMEKSLVDTQNALIDLFSVTNTNATETGRILQDQIISRLERIRDIGSNMNEISQQSSGNNPLGMSQSDFKTYVDNKKKAEDIKDPTDARFQRLLAENERLRKKYGIKGDFYSYKQLVGYYKDGGINTSPGLAMLHGTPSKPEWILNTDQMKKLINNLAFSNVTPKIPSYNNLSGSKGSTIQISNLINVEGNATEDVIPQIKSAGMNIVNQLKGWGVVIPNG